MSKRTERLHALARRHGWFCRYCGIPVIEPLRNELVKRNTATLDHVISIADGGRDHISNIVIACRDCNQWKGRHSIQNISQLSDNERKELVYSFQFIVLPPIEDGLNRAARIRKQKKMQEGGLCKSRKRCRLSRHSDVTRCLAGRTVICPKFSRSPVKEAP